MRIVRAPRVEAASTSGLVLTAGLSGLSLGATGLVLPLLAIAEGATPGQWGTIAGVYIVGLGIFELTWGLLSDRIGIRPILIATRFGIAAVGVLIMATPGLTPLYALQFLLGSVDAALWPMGKALIGRVIDPARKGGQLGSFYAAVALGSSVGSVLAGLGIERFGHRPTLLLSVGAALVAGTVALVTLREPARRLAPIVVRAGRGSGPPPRAHWGRLLAIGAMSTLALTSNGGMTTFLPLVATLSLGLSSATAGILATIFTITMAILIVPMGHFGDRTGRRRALLLGLGCSAIALPLIGLAGGLPALIAAVFLAGVGRAIWQPARIALLSNAMPFGRQGAVMGLIGTFEDLGTVTGSVLGGLVWTLWGRSTTYAGYGLFLIAALVVCLIFVRERAWASELAGRP